MTAIFGPAAAVVVAIALLVKGPKFALAAVFGLGLLYAALVVVAVNSMD